MCKQSQHNLIRGDRPCELMRGWTRLVGFGEFSEPILRDKGLSVAKIRLTGWAAVGEGLQATGREGVA